MDIEADSTLSSNCTCPYQSTCKHAVAVVLDYLEQTKKFYEIPTIAKDDRRLSQLDSLSSENQVSVNQGQNEQTQSISLRHYLEGQTKEQLVQLLEELAVRYTQVHEVLQDKSNFASGAVEKIVAVIRSDIDALEQEYSD